MRAVVVLSAALWGLILPGSAAAKSPEKRCEALKPVQQLETERERKVNVFLQAAVPGYGRGKVKVDVDASRSWDVSLLKGDDLAQAFYGYQLCVMRASGMLEASDHLVLLKAAYGLEGGAPAPAPPRPDKPPSNLDQTPLTDLGEADPGSGSGSGVEGGGVDAPADAATQVESACPVRPGGTINLRFPLNLFSFDVGETRFKLMNATGATEALELLRTCGAYEAAAALQTFRVDQKTFNRKMSPAAYKRMHVQYRLIALDLAKITGAACTTKVPRRGVQSCEEALKTWAPEAAE